MSQVAELVDTGKKCPYCGRALKQGVVHFAGKEMRFSIICPCQVAKHQVEEAERERRKHKETVRRLVLTSGLPRKWQGVKFDGYIERHGAGNCKAACERYVERFQKFYKKGVGMYLTGPTGSGKTHLAAAVANALLEQSVRVVWWNVTSLYEALRASYSRPDGPDIVGGCKRAALLILDDLGAEKPTEWTEATMYDIVNSRIDDLRPTVITSNLTIEDLAKAADPRLVSRISDASIFPSVVNHATDYRRERR